MPRRGGVAAAAAADPAAVATAIVIVSAASARGGPAALLPWDGGTVLGRLLAQLAALGVADVRVVVRPAWEREVREAASPAGARVEATAGPDADLRSIAAAAREPGAGMVVLPGELLTHGEALAGLLKDPRVATGALLGGGWHTREFAFRVRSKRGRVISAASPYHSVHRPTSAFLGVIKIAAADRALAATTADELAALAADPSEEWREELARKQDMWRMALWRAASAPATEAELEREADDEPAEDYEDDPEPADEPAPESVELSPEDEARLRNRFAAAPEDTTALLLVGLVRSGHHVGVSRLRRLFWARPFSEPAIAAAEERITHYDEDKVLLDSAVKSSDGFFTTFFVSPYSRYIARWAARRGFTPNQVTTVSVLIGLAAAICFATGERWGMIAGALLLQASFTTDCVDGQLARYTRTFSKFGAWLDSIFDRTKEYLAFAGLAIGASQTGDNVWLLACCALTLQTVRHSTDFAFGAGQTQVIGATEQPPLARSRDAMGIAALERRARAEATGDAGAAAAPRPAAPPPRVVAAPPPAALAPDRPAAGRPLDQEDDRVPDRGAVRGDLDHRGAVQPARDVHRPAGLGRRRRRLHPLGPRAAVDRPMTAAPAPASAATVAPLPPSEALYRDDGPLARAIGRVAGGVPVPAMALLLAGLAPLAVVAAVEGDGASTGLAAAVIAWLIACHGITSARWPSESFTWAVPPLIRLGEYAGITWIAALAGEDALPAAYALLATLAFRHYDIVYRRRHRAEVPPAWLDAVALGWEGRLVLAWVLLALDALPAAMFVWAALLAVVSVGETVMAWRRFGRAPRPAEYDDVEEDEAA